MINPAPLQSPLRQGLRVIFLLISQSVHDYSPTSPCSSQILKLFQLFICLPIYYLSTLHALLHQCIFSTLKWPVPLKPLNKQTNELKKKRVKGRVKSGGHRSPFTTGKTTLVLVLPFLGTIMYRVRQSQQNYRIQGSLQKCFFQNNFKQQISVCGLSCREKTNADSRIQTLTALYQTGELQKYTFILVTDNYFFLLCGPVMLVQTRRTLPRQEEVKPPASPSPDPPYLHAIHLFRLENVPGYLLTV